jgi:tripartite-type tricarboxylate transporter receptor subunit TctC
VADAARVAPPAMMFVSSSLPYRAPKDVVAPARASPGKLSFATGGNGTPPHLAAAIFAGMTGIDLIHVPYKGSGPAHIDLIQGRLSDFRYASRTRDERKT